MTDYKVLRRGAACHGGWGKWTKGRRRSVRGRLVPCENGIHYCRDSQILKWLGGELWEFVDLTPDEAVDCGDKRVTRAGKVTQRYETWNERTARLFAVDCSRLAVDCYAQDDQEALLHACLDVMVGYVDGFTDEAAASAARSAARSEQYALLCRYLNGEEGPFVGGAGREP